MGAGGAAGCSRSPRDARVDPMNRWFSLVAVVACTFAAFVVWWLRDRPQDLADAPEGKLDCVSYTPFRRGQSPGDAGLVIPPSQIAEDLALLAGRVACVRTYAVDMGLDRVPEMAERHGIEVMLGLWIGADAKRNASEMATGIAVANARPRTVRSIVVGNEVMLRGDVAEARLAQVIDEVRRGTSVPVTYADVWEFWVKHRRLADHVDFVTIHILPYWENVPTALDRAVPYTLDVWRKMSAFFAPKPVFVGEVGWPSAGRARAGAVPGRVNQARFVREFARMAAAEGLAYNVIEAFDQPWKRRQEGTVGGNWGLYTAERTLKFPFSGPVGGDPLWRPSLLAAALLAALPVAWLAAGGVRLGPSGWLAVAAAAEAAAGALVLHARYYAEASRTTWEWSVGAAGLGVGALTAWLLVAALAEALAGRPALAAPPLPLARAIAFIRRPRAADAPPGLALGSLQWLSAFAGAAVTLELVFQARYRNFPLAAFAVPAFGFALAALAGRRAPACASGRSEDACLAGALLVGVVLVLAQEGFENPEALAWSAIALLLAAPFLPALWGRVAALRRKGG
jgi:glucan 1,3-beta-glucosidase